MANSTVSDSIEDARQEAGLESDTTIPAAQDSAMIRATHKYNAEFINASFRGVTLPLRGQPVQITGMRTGWSFMAASTNITIVAPDQLNGALTTASTSVILDSATNFDDAGKIIIYSNESSWDVVSYTGKSSNTLTGATGIASAKLDNDVVSKLYAVPSDFGKIRSLTFNKSLYRLIESEPDFYNQTITVGDTVVYLGTTPFPDQNTVTIIDDYFWFPKNHDDGIAVLQYWKAPTNLDTGTDSTSLTTLIDLPPEYEDYIKYRNLTRLLRIMGRDATDIYEAEAEAISILQSAMKTDVKKAVPNRITLLR